MPSPFTASSEILTWRKAQGSGGGSVSTPSLWGYGSSPQRRRMSSFSSLRVSWSTNYMQRLRSLKEGLTLLSPGKCQQMTLSPTEPGPWLLDGRGGSIGELGESGALRVTRNWDQRGTSWLSPCHFVLLDEILKIHHASFMKRILKGQSTSSFLTWLFLTFLTSS